LNKRQHWIITVLIGLAIPACGALLAAMARFYIWGAEQDWSKVRFELVKGLPAAFVTLIIGAIAAGIAYRQYEVAKAKLKLDLFEKRYAIFHQTWEILSEAATKGARENNYGLATPFNNFLPEAAFLFGKPIERYLDEASTKWAELRALEAETDGAGIDRAANIAKASELQQWFFEQASKGAKAQFGRYLDFENWK
jgi:hypothetical protein